MQQCISDLFFLQIFIILKPHFTQHYKTFIFYLNFNFNHLNDLKIIQISSFLSIWLQVNLKYIYYYYYYYSNISIKILTFPLCITI